MLRLQLCTIVPVYLQNFASSILCPLLASPVCISRSLIFVESYIVLCDWPVSLSLSLGLTHIVVCIRISSQIKTGRFSILLYKHCVYPLAIMRPVHLFSPVADSAELVCPGISSGPCFPFFGVCITCVCVFSFLRNCISYTTGGHGVHEMLYEHSMCCSLLHAHSMCCFSGGCLSVFSSNY